MAFLKKIKFGESSTNIAKTVVNGAPSGVIAVTNTQNYENNDSEEKDYSYDIDVRVDDATIVKDGDTSKVLKVGTVPATQVSVADSAGVFTAENVETALKELKDDIAEVDGAAKSYTIVEKTESLPTNVAHRYKLQQTIGEGASAQVSEVGENIDILKDNSLLAAKLSTTDATWNGSAIVDGEGDEALVLVYKDAEGTAQVIAIDVSAFLKEGEFKDGLAVSANGEVSAKLGQGLEFGGESGENQSIKVKIDSTSESFLTVGAGGVKLAGVQDAINAKVNALDVTDDTAVAGQYVAAIEETDGVVAVKARANVSDAVLTGYTKGTKPASTAIAATDDVKGAIAKLEHQIDDAKAAATTKVVEGTDAGNNLSIDTATSASDGSTTYTINLTDVASAEGLADEITRAQSAETAIDSAVGLTKAASGETRSFTPTTNYGGTGASAATSVVENMQKIDTALKAVSDKADAIQYKVDGTTLEFFGMTVHA